MASSEKGIVAVSLRSERPDPRFRSRRDHKPDWPEYVSEAREVGAPHKEAHRGELQVPVPFSVRFRLKELFGYSPREKYSCGAVRGESGT